MYNDLLLLQRRKLKQVKKILFDTYCPMHTITLNMILTQS